MNPEFEGFENDFLAQEQIEDCMEDYQDYQDYLDTLDYEVDWAFDNDNDEYDYEDDGQPDEYTEWQDYMGGDDWDHGQFDDSF
jgi:hypothetical protein